MLQPPPALTRAMFQYSAHKRNPCEAVEKSHEFCPVHLRCYTKEERRESKSLHLRQFLSLSLSAFLLRFKDAALCDLTVTISDCPFL